MVGFSSHTAAKVYYLSHARYLSKILQSAQALSEMFKKNHCTAVINDDSDEDKENSELVRSEGTHDNKAPRFMRGEGTHYNKAPWRRD